MFLSISKEKAERSAETFLMYQQFNNFHSLALCYYVHLFAFL